MQGVLRIGVISDTHDHLPGFVVSELKAAGLDEIWHLGDVTAEHILDDLHILDVPIHVVRGNCDFNYEWPLIIDLKRHGIRFRLQHIPPNRHHLPENTDILLHGHTHVPRDETVHGIRFLNPGTIGKPNKGAPPSFAFLTIGANGEVGWEIRKI
ncbi:MAG: metallophosphatase family protein [Verrucomicrobiales bacterium]|jgi:putative phosphoesterase|nr:metallophosphatase family protein [Verrucomicrobiales bacterium]